jgi:hypothetical protein
VALEHTSAEVVVCSARKWTRFTCTVEGRSTLLLSGLHMPHRGDGFTVVSIMPPTLPQAGTLRLSGCFVGTNNSLHRCVSAVRGIEHSMDSQEFLIGPQGNLSNSPGTEAGFRIATTQLLQSVEPSPTRFTLPKRIEGAPAVQERR